MKKALIFATNNQHKVNEVRSLLKVNFDIITLQEANITIDIPEPFDTLEANAREKARTIYQLTQKNCFSEDTGLEVEALNGEPGVKTARYAGDDKDFKNNIDKLLKNLAGITHREARFRTVIALILDNKEYLFEGICEGSIIPIEKGNKGFGYDPVFKPEGADQTFAEMTMEEKSKFSHRRKATDKLIEFLATYNK